VGRHAARLLRQEDRAGEQDIATPPTFLPALKQPRRTLLPYSHRIHNKQQPCPTNPTTTSPAPHHHPPTTWTPSPPPQPAQPPSHPQKKNGNPTPKENGKSHCNSWNCFLRWCWCPTWASTLAVKLLIGVCVTPTLFLWCRGTDVGTQDGRSIWSGNILCILRLRIRACSRVSVLLKLLPRCEKSAKRDTSLKKQHRELLSKPCHHQRDDLSALDSTIQRVIKRPQWTRLQLHLEYHRSSYQYNLPYSRTSGHLQRHWKKGLKSRSFLNPARVGPTYRKRSGSGACWL
jgi:hypothetical protein